MKSAQKKSRVAAMALGVMVALASSPVWSETRGRCARVTLPWPIVLPDGSNHDAGVLKLCLQQIWTPVTGLHEIKFDELSHGLFKSKVGRNEDSVSDRPIVVFRRDESDRYHLLGYAWPNGKSMRTYRVQDATKPAAAITHDDGLPLIGSENTMVIGASSSG
jgi:hypothetical protein